MLLLHDSGVGPPGIAALLAVMAVPTIATMGIAGRVADSFDSRTILVTCGLVQAAACVVVGAFPIAAVVYATAFVIALAQAFSQPTWQALVPRIVGEERIGQAVAWQQGLSAVAGPLGAALGGILYGVGALQWAFWGDGIGYLALTGAAFAIRSRRLPAARVEHASWAAGIRIVARDRIVWPLFAAILVFVVLVEGINAVEVFLARDVLGATAWQYGLVELFAGAGALVGAFIAGRMVREGQRIAGAVLGFGVAAVALIAAGAAPSFWFYAAAVTGLSAAFGLGNATFGALLTTRTPDGQRGRVYAALGGLARTAGLVALALGSLAGTVVGPRWTFVIAGALGAAVMAVVGIRLSAVRRSALRSADATISGA
jgi:MFS family permease